MYGYIYKTTNLVNGKFYIGQHKSSSFDEKYYGSGMNLKRAIGKYGKENFIVEILQICESNEELNEAEIWWIAKLDAIKVGYNIDVGGQKGPKESPEITGEKISKGHRKKLDKIKEQIIKDSVSGSMTISAIAEKYHTSIEVLQKFYQENNIAPYFKKMIKDIWAERKNEVEEKFHFKTVGELAFEYGISTNEMGYILSSLGLKKHTDEEIKNIKEENKKRREKMREMIINGETTKSIREATGYKEKRIQEERRKMGIFPSTIQKRGLPFSKEELELLYVEKDLTTNEISNMLNIPKNDIICGITRYKLRKKEGSPYFYQKKWTEEKIETIRKMTNDGKTVKQIAEFFGVSVCTIKEIKKKKSISSPKQKSVFSLENIGDIVEEIKLSYSKGETIEKVCSSTGLSSITIKRIAKKYGIVHPNAPNPYSEKDKRIVHDLFLLKKMSTSEIANIVGRTQCSVRNLIKSQGWHRKRKQGE